MKALLLWLMLGTSSAAMAQTVQVASGEHDRFSRLVLTFPTAVDWRVFRTETGYGLTVAGTKPRYDLSDVYRLIPRNRLATIFADPASGALQLGIGCACHVMPFELRPGVVVLDIQDGPAPAGSSFELAETGAPADPLAARTGPRPVARPQTIAAAPTNRPTLDWRADLAAAARTPSPAPITPGNPALNDMRAALLWQIGRGAAKGVVEMTAPARAAPDGGQRHSTSAQSHLNIGGINGLDANAGDRLADQMTATGISCIPDHDLDLSGWSGPQSVAAQIGLIRSGLVGEFDRPDGEAIAKSVKFYLHSGFGIEARQLLQELETGSANRAVWESMAYILDEEPPPTSAFAQMAVCDTSAALWAVLSEPELPNINGLRTEAVLRGFSALPLHLRRHLGPGLAERYLNAGDTETARAIRDAILRAAGEQGAGVRLLEAEIALANDPDTDAQAALAPLMQDTGPVGIDATIALAAHQIASGAVVDPALTTAVAAYLHENKGSPREQALRDTLALGLASQGLYGQALALGELSPSATGRVWQHLATAGPDSDLIGQAILDKASPLPDLPAQTRKTLAARLVALGFAGPAHRWLQAATATSQYDPEAQILTATAHLLRDDARAAITALAGQTGAEAEAVRARALDQLSDPAAIASHGKSGDVGRQEQSARRLQAWDDLARISSDPVWTKAAELLAGPLPAGPTTTAEPAPLAESRALLAESAEMRSVLENLLKNSALPTESR